jgi:3-hydroxyacyl-[acyl-carrier-protein] dehydratase
MDASEEDVVAASPRCDLLFKVCFPEFCGNRYLASTICYRSPIMDPIAFGLPHRFPFVFIDEVDKVDPGVEALAHKRFVGDEPFFQGHFPGNPIVPGVLIIEAMAQTAGIAIGGPGKTFLLTAIRAMKFLRPIKPQENIQFRARRLAEANRLVQCTVEARVDDEIIAEGQLVLAQTNLPGVGP